MLEKTCLLLLLMCLHIAAASMSLSDHVIKMEQVILPVEYNHRRLNVWKEDNHGNNRFYVTPLCTLERASLKCRRDDLSTEHRHALSFNVKMWDLEAAETVKLALTQKNIEAKVTDIFPLPMLMARLGISQGVEKFYVDKEWRSVQNLPNVITFELYTRHECFCDKKLKDAISDPEAFLASTKMYIEFTMVVGQHATRSLNITGETFVKSKFLSNLENKHSNGTGIIYLASSDLNKLARDIYRNALAHEEVDSTYISSEHENQIIFELLEAIKSQTTVHSRDLAKDEWNSVFWDNIFSRPDVQTEYFNKVLKYDEGEKQFKYNRTADRDFTENKLNKYHNEKETTVSHGAEFSIAGLFGLGGDTSVTHKTISEGENKHDVHNISKDTISLDDLQKHLKKDYVNVKWTGTKFTPKNLLLYRINAKTLKSSGELLYRRIEITKYESTQKIEIRSEPTLQIVNPVFHEEFKNQVAELKKLSDNTTSIFQTRYENVNQLSEKIKQYFENTTASFEKIKQDLESKTSILQTRYENIERNFSNYISNLSFYISNPPQVISFTPGSIVAGKDLFVTGKLTQGLWGFSFTLQQGRKPLFHIRMEGHKNQAKFYCNIHSRSNETNIGYEGITVNPGLSLLDITLLLEFKDDRLRACHHGSHCFFIYLYRPGDDFKFVDRIYWQGSINMERIELERGVW